MSGVSCSKFQAQCSSPLHLQAVLTSWGESLAKGAAIDETGKGRPTVAEDSNCAHLPVAGIVLSFFCLSFFLQVFSYIGKETKMTRLQMSSLASLTAQGQEAIQKIMCI